MTPAQHKTQAETMLTAYEAGDPGRQYAIDRASLIRVHAELARTAGTGTHYTAAEAALTKAEDTTTVPVVAERLVRAAHVHALLADQ